MRAKRISRAHAERLLGGNLAGHPLADLLAAAAAPGRPQELAGEADVMAAFQTALLDTAVQAEPHRETRSLRSMFAKVPTAVTAGVFLAVTAVGGVAIAAGGIPGRTSDTPKKPAPSGSSVPELTPKHASAAPRPATAAPAASGSLTDLCRTYLVGGRQARQLAPLIKAAGGRQKILRFCFQALGGDRSKPATWPSGWPKVWPQDQNWSPELPGLPKDWLPAKPGHRQRATQRAADPPIVWPADWPRLKF